jgi:hypothetical protein
VIWSLGDPAGQRFTGFKPTAPIARGNFPTEHLTWSLDKQGNGLAFYQEVGSTFGLEYGNQAVHVYQVSQYLPQPGPEIWANTALISQHKDPEGNGWILTQGTPPAGTSPRNPPPVQPIQAHRLSHHRLIAGEVQTLPAEVRGSRFVLDTEGNGLAIRHDTSVNTKEALWLQRLERFVPTGEVEQLAANSGPWQLNERNGQGVLAWMVRNDQNLDISYEFLSIDKYRAERRLGSVPLKTGENKRLGSIQLKPGGHGTIAWEVQSYPTNSNGPVTTYQLQVIQAYQPGQSLPLPSTQDEIPSWPSLFLDATGRGLAIWQQQPRSMNQDFGPNRDTRLMAISLENYLPTGQPLTLSESSQAGVYAAQIQISPEGHGLIVWTQFNQRCEQVGCTLDQTVWARAVYGFRIPKGCTFKDGSGSAAANQQRRRHPARLHSGPLSPPPFCDQAALNGHLL